MIKRGEIYWEDRGPAGGRPAKRRPVLIVQAASFNESRLATTLAVVIASNTGLSAMPGDVFLPATVTGLPHDGVADVAHVDTVNKDDLEGPVGAITGNLLHQIEQGLRRVLGL